MIRIAGRGAAYGDLWFDEELPRDPGVDIVRYRCRDAPIERERCTPCLSLVSDLAVDADALVGAFGKDCRYKIRRADTKDGLQMEFITAPADRLREFRAFFDSFARQKSHEPSDGPWLRAACEAGQLVLTRASQGGEDLVWHAYIVCGGGTWLQYTGSCFRDRENDYRALVGRANRWLHWKDMLQFKERGITRYDWGGVFADESAPNRSGIDEFKRSFGGRDARTYDCTVPLTLRGRVYLPLRDAWRSRTAVLPGRFRAEPLAEVSRKPRAA
jgi:hypothetical protein